MLIGIIKYKHYRLGDNPSLFFLDSNRTLSFKDMW
jgi:hypothetical protein